MCTGVSARRPAWRIAARQASTGMFSSATRRARQPQPAELDHVADHRSADIRPGRRRDGHRPPHRHRPSPPVRIRRPRAGSGGRPQHGRPVHWLGDRSAPGSALSRRHDRPTARPGTPATPRVGPPGQARPTPAGPPDQPQPAPAAPDAVLGPGEQLEQPAVAAGHPGQVRHQQPGAAVEQLVQPTLQPVEPRIVELPGHRQQIHCSTLIVTGASMATGGFCDIRTHPRRASLVRDAAKGPGRPPTAAAAPSGVPTATVALALDPTRL